VGVEIDVLAHEMRALAEPGERRREHLVALFLQQVGDAAPAPSAVPGAVDQHEGFARAALRVGLCAAERGCAGAGTRARQHAAPGDGRIVRVSHGFLQ